MIVKEFHARKAGPFKIMKRVRPNAYVLEIPPDLGISPTFNISNLMEHREPAVIPSEPFEPLPSFKSEPIPECPHTIWLISEKKSECILDDQAISTRDEGYQRYLVRWQG